MAYMFSWGDTTQLEWTPFYASGLAIVREHNYLELGNHAVKVKAKDERGRESKWSAAISIFAGNTKPNAPERPSGPAACSTLTQVAFATSAVDPDGDSVRIRFIWGEGNRVSGWSSLVATGTAVTESVVYLDPGEKQVRAVAMDEDSAVSDTSAPKVLFANPKNWPPNVPATPAGPDTGWAGEYQVFSTSATDPDGDSVSIRFIWGEDGRVSSWSQPVPSGAVVADSVVYSFRGTKHVRAVAMDWGLVPSETSGAKVFYVNQANTPPAKPILTGPNRGIKNGPYYRFYASASDPNRDNIQYKFFWGDGNSSNWSAFSPNQAIVMDSWRYPNEATYSLRVVARDQRGAVSDTSDAKTFEVVGEGAVLWSVMFGDEIVSSPALGDAINSRGETRPAVIIGVTNGFLEAVDAYQSENLYDAYENDNEPYLCSPAVGANGNVYIGNGNGRVYAYDRSGTLKWSYPDSSTGDDMYATPLVDGTSIYVGGENRYITQLRDNGSTVSVVWSYPLQEELIASPVLDANGNLIVCDDSGYVYSFAPDHTLNWTYATSNNITSSPAVGPDGTVYFGTEQGNVFAITSGGAQAWPPYEASASVSSSPVIGSDGSIYFGADNGCIYRLDNTGQPVPNWPVQLCLSDVASTPALCADGVIYVTADNDTMYAVTEDGAVAWSVGLVVPGQSLKPRPPHRFGVDDLLPSPVVGQYGIIYVACGSDGLLAIAGRSLGTLANTAWPMFHHDVKHTGKYGGW